MVMVAESCALIPPPPLPTVPSQEIVQKRVAESTAIIIPPQPITNGTISGNTATDGYGGGISCNDSSPTISNCTILSNSAYRNGGGISCGYSSSPTITNCIISGNSSGKDGGGIGCDSSSPTITNCTISGNSASYDGGGIYCEYSSPTITNCTILSNSATGDDGAGGGILCHNSSPSITNNIITNNIKYGVYRADSSSTPTINYNNLWNNGTANANCSLGVGNISADPQFISENDFHLKPISPCIDAGLNTASCIPEKDKDDNPRIVDGNNDGQPVVDMGAYEYQGILALTLESYPATTTTNVAFPIMISLTDAYNNPCSGTITLSNLTNSISPHEIPVNGTGTCFATITTSPNGGTDTITARYNDLIATATIIVYINTQQGTVTYGGTESVKIEFGSGSLQTANVRVFVSTSTTLPSQLPSGIMFAGIVYNIDLTDDNNNLYGTQSLLGSVTLYLSYQDKNNDGFVDNTKIKERDLIIYQWDNGTWTALLPTHINYTENYALAHPLHFSTFTLGGTPTTFAKDNNNAYCFPNPWKGNYGPYVYFAEVSEGSIIKIYTIAGEKIDEIEVKDSPQKWNVKDKNIASGIYIYTVTGGKGGKKVGKIGIVK